MLTLAVTLFALAATSPVTTAPPETSVTSVTSVTSIPEAESAVTQSARRWLTLVDASDWQASWQATATSFRNANTVAGWASASQTARVPLGAALSRVLISEDAVPTPPKGNMVLKFRTSFAAKSAAVETLALVREDGGWRVVGYYID